MPGTSNNGGEHSTGGIISCKASFAHTGSIINNKGGNFVFHFLEREGEERLNKGEDCLKLMVCDRFAFHLANINSSSSPVITEIGHWRSQWRRI